MSLSHCESRVLCPEVSPSIFPGNGAALCSPLGFDRALHEHLPILCFAVCTWEGFEVTRKVKAKTW